MAQTQQLDIDAALKAEQERLASRKEELSAELDEINVRLARIGRYFTEEEPADRRFKLTPPKPPIDRRNRGYVQEQVKATVFAHRDGITSGDLNKALEGISPQSIQNALAALRRSNQIIKDGDRGGKFRPIVPDSTPPAEADAPH
jgi:hypothetical protein